MSVCKYLALSLALCSCASPRILGDPYRDSPKVRVSKAEFASYEFKAFPDGPLCDGSKAKSRVVYSTTLTLPIIHGVLLSTASKEDVELVHAVEDYLKNNFLNNASHPELQTENFSNCTEYRVSTGHSGYPGICWIGASNRSRGTLNRNIPYVAPILLAHSSDLAALTQNYVLASPGVSSERAFTGRYFDWKRFLSTATLKEADQPDGSVKYELSLDMSPVCQDSVPVSGLFSK